MKKLIYCFGLAILILGSCNQDEEQQPVVDENKTPDEFISEIDLMEEETGIVFYKKDIIVTDASGKSEVIIRIAHKNESMLKNYLEATSFSIVPTFNSPYNSSEKPSPILEDNQDQINQNTDGIFTEFISIKLEENAIGFTTHVKMTTDPSILNRTKANGFPNQATHTSMVWPEICKVWAYASVGYEFERKKRWYSSWNNVTFCNYFNSSDCQSYWEQPGSSEQWTGIDGPYKVRLIIDYEYYYDYSFEFVDN